MNKMKQRKTCNTYYIEIQATPHFYFIFEFLVFMMAALFRNDGVVFLQLKRIYNRLEIKQGIYFITIIKSLVKNKIEETIKFNSNSIQFQFVLFKT
jgi:hypothetical protein